MIYVIRHGETAANAARVLQTPDAPLSQRGEQQAARLARRLQDVGVARILSSDLARARATAEALRDATAAPLELEPLLQERNFGALRGTPYAALGVDPFAEGYLPPEGESWEAFHARVDAAWARITAAAGCPGSLAVVTHGLVCYSLATRLLSLPPGVDPTLGMANTAVTVIDRSARVHLYNCTAHLSDR